MRTVFKGDGRHSYEQWLMSGGDEVLRDRDAEIVFRHDAWCQQLQRRDACTCAPRIVVRARWSSG